MAQTNLDKEVQHYRDLVTPPGDFPKSFGMRMVVASLFLGLIMVPGAIYMSLFVGASFGPASQWVTVILFAEVAKRSMKGLRQQEIFLLFYMAGIALGGSMNLTGSLLTQLLWNQYLVQAPATISMGIAADIPSWIAPAKEILESAPRTFYTSYWITPIAFLCGTMIISRIDQFGLGYVLYRWTTRVEKLPFPMASVGALGVSALADSKDPKDAWKWRAFSIGGVIGIGFGLIYIGVPALSGALLGQSIQIIPLPWLDLTPTLSTESFMPAVPLNIVFDLGMILLGMVLPFWAVVGGFIGLMVTWAINPILYHNGTLTGWQPGMGVVDTVFYNHLDFYLSFSIGLTFAIFMISIGATINPLIKHFFTRSKPSTPRKPLISRSMIHDFIFSHSRERGDISILLALGIYFFSTCSYLTICYWLVPGFTGTVALFFVAFAFGYQPIMSYVNAKLEGLVGQTVQIPMVREAAFIFSGYKGAALWFAPIPIHDTSRSTQQFKIMELTGTRVTDVIKIELITIPVLIITALVFCDLIWRMAPIPGAAYPFTLEMWDLQARMFALQVTATTEGSSLFLEAIKFDVIGWGLGVGVLSFMFLSFLNLPTFLVYGAVRGMGQTVPGVIIFEMIGALIGRFYLRKKLGDDMYKRYVMVLFAGYSAGAGVVAMAAVAIALIAKSTTTMGY